MAADELERALTLSWRELAAVAPWGDAYDGFSPAGRQVTVERSYIWAEDEMAATSSARSPSSAARAAGTRAPASAA